MIIAPNSGRTFVLAYLIQHVLSIVSQHKSVLTLLVAGMFAFFPMFYAGAPWFAYVTYVILVVIVYWRASARSSRRA